jgi:hypothetical protein
MLAECWPEIFAALPEHMKRGVDIYGAVEIQQGHSAPKGAKGAAVTAPGVNSTSK